mmetsp:Transcript_57458/g.125780  ORF Transcript_57458/g.125780 Transcript_57458/m.125780 type:complete len:172 (+) Transcript_57458:44-559(+)
MAEGCQDMIVLVVVVVAMLTTFVLGPLSAQVLAAVNPFIGMVLPFACMLCAAGCLCTSLCASEKKQRDADYEEPERPMPQEDVSAAEFSAPVPHPVGATAPRWQVKAGPGGGWIDFDLDVSLEIDDAQARGEEAFQVTVRGQAYEINLVEMHQKNLSTGRKRSIRHTGHYV